MKVKGSEKVVEQYLGIPFAQPPVGPLRLAAPNPVQGWEGIRNATEHPLMCLQNPDIVLMVSKAMKMDFTPTGISEDCLYLNVYTPSQRSESEKLPVMVWIHGGGLVMGGASMFDGSPLAAYENIVVVVIQYRLGMLGFFSTGDKLAQGNWGFLDQITALQWVQQNIEGFGGDPQSVTIAGESAGGISASFLTLSPMTKGLFHRAIFQSGVATSVGHSTRDPLTYGKLIANVTECDFSSSEVLVKCIKELTEEQIINATKKKRIFLGATVDGVFLKDLPEEILKSKDFQKVPILVGTTNHECGWILIQVFVSGEWVKGMDTKSVKAILDTVNEADAGVPVYMYEFQHRPSIFKDVRPSFVKADHADDVGFVFGACFWDGHIKIVETLSEEENKLCRTVMGYWANFIRTGSPNGPGLVHWPVYDQSNKYMNLGMQQTEGQGLKMGKLLFFTEELPKKLAALHTA
ncbi:Cocaine esterase [Anabarilius grahami]|uniref:Carboxylic ester hydrolase n=1 Tax=Anabarilius grahami TaxID=495550 RepID=A0A3N0YAQ6_ANAGA|nr:Cocaine esterase [Anabarilius grahami]